MADFKFQISKEGTVYDWPQVIGQAPGLYNEEDRQAAATRFAELPFEKKKQLYDAWVPDMRSALKDAGANDLSPFENYAQNELGFLEEAYGAPEEDTWGEEIQGAIGKTYEGIADRAEFLANPKTQLRMAQVAPPGVSQLAQAAIKSPITEFSRQAALGYADLARTTGENLQAGTTETTGTFEPLKGRWWVEKGLPTVGGLLTDMGLSLSTGPAAPITFAISAGSQIGGQVEREANSEYQATAKQKYMARLEAGASVAEARTQLRGELQKGKEDAATEASLVSVVSAVINSIPGARFTAPVRQKVKDTIVKKGLVGTLQKLNGNPVGGRIVTGLTEGATEILDEVLQDTGRAGRDLGQGREILDRWKNSDPWRRYAASGVLGTAAGAGVDIGTNVSKLALSKATGLRDRVTEQSSQQAPAVPSQPPAMSGEVSTEQAPTEPPESDIEASVEEVVTPESEIVSDEEINTEEGVPSEPEEFDITEEEITPNEPPLPNDIRRSKPRYNYGRRPFELEFASPVDMALFIASQENKSKRDADFRKYLKGLGFTDADIDRYGKGVRREIKSLVVAELPNESSTMVRIPRTRIRPRSLLVKETRTPRPRATAPETQAISNETEVAPIRYKKDISRGQEVSWLTSLGTIESGIVRSRDKDTITFEDGRTKEFRPEQIFSGRVTPKPNTANMEVGDVIFPEGQGAFYQYLGNGEFNVGSINNGEITFDRYIRDPLGRDIIDDPRTLLYGKDAFDGAADSYNSRPDPKNNDKFSPYLQQIGEKPYDQGRAVQPSQDGQANQGDRTPAGITGDPQGVPVSQGSGQEASQEQVQEAVASAALSNTQTEEASISQLRTELTRRARLDKGKDARIQQAQVDNLVSVIDASATAIASRTGRAKEDILARVAFSHDKPANVRTPRSMAGEYDLINRIIRLYPNANATTVVHEWMHFVLEEHIYNTDDSLNILNREERKLLEDYAREKADKPKRGEDAGLFRSAGKPSKRYHEFMADLMEHVFQRRYQDGNKPSGIPDNIFNLLKKVGDFVRQVYSKVRYNWRAQDFDGSAREEAVLALIDRIFIPEQTETLVNEASPPPDVVLPAPNLTEAPNVGKMYADLQANSQSQVRPKVADQAYRKIDRLQAEGRLGQTVPQQELQAREEAPVRPSRYRQPMLASRELDIALETGITDYVNLMERSAYAVQSRESTKRAARDFLGKMTTGEAIATIMGDPYSASAPIQGALPPEVYVASAMILANRLRGDLQLLPQAISEGKISANDALEISGVYERYLKYFVETIAPGAGRSVDILNEYRAPVSTQNRMARLLGVLGSTNSRLIQRGVEKLGPERLAWIRSYAERNRQGTVTPENYQRRVREFKQAFQESFPPQERAFARAYINDAARLFQTIVDNPDTNVPGAAVQAFGQNYWFSPALWNQIEALMPLLDALPDDSIIRDLVNGEVIALLSTEAGIPLGSLLSSHYMAQYLCAPSTTTLSLIGNAALMSARIAGLVAGFSTNPDGRGVNPNLAYLPQMFRSIAQSYGPARRGRVNSGAVWKNIRSALSGFGPGTRMHQGRLSGNEIYRSAIRYTTPSGRIENLGDVFSSVYSLLIAAPFRLLSVADAAVGTGTKGLTGTVAAAQVAYWNAERYRSGLEADPTLIPPAFGNSVDRATRAFRNAEYTRLMGHQPAQMQAALATATAQVDAVLATPELGRSRLAAPSARQTMIWGAYQQELDRIREQEMASVQNVPEPDQAQILMQVRQDAQANGATMTPAEEQAEVDRIVDAQLQGSAQAVLTNYQQEQELDRALSSFSYIPRGHMGEIVRTIEQLVARVGMDVGRLGGDYMVTQEGTLAVQGGVNVGNVLPLRFILPFLRASALGVVATVQSTPFGWLAVARNGPLGAPGTWTQAERNTFAMMSLIGSVVFLTALAKAWDDDDPLEEGKEHTIGPIPDNDWGRRLKARGIEPYTRYTLNSDGSVSKMKLNTIQGPFISPLLMVGAYNSVRWNDAQTDKESNSMEQAFSASKLMVKTLGAMGPMGQLAKYGMELDDKKFDSTYSNVSNSIKNLGMDGILMYRRAFNEVGALMNNAGIAAGMNWEPDTKNIPATVQGDTAVNILKTLTNDYLIDGGQSRPMLNGYGEPLAEDPQLAKKIATITPKTPMNDLLVEHGLTLAPMSRYKNGIRKGSSEDMKELFAEVGRKRSETLPRHLVGDLRDNELYDYMKDFYGPLLQKTVGAALSGDPYSKPEVESVVSEALEDPANNNVMEDNVKRQALQKYVDALRSQTELISMAQYFAAKNPDLDSDFVADYVTDLIEAAQEGEDFR